MTIVPSVQDTAYPRLKSNTTLKELTTIYSPNPDELSLAQQVTTIGSSTRLGFLVLLKTFQRLGYGVLVQDVPVRIVHHIATVAHLEVSRREIDRYDDSATRKRHLGLIRDYLHLHPYSKVATPIVEEVMQKAALTQQDLADLINVGIEELVRQRFELPAFSTLKRVAQQVRAQVTATFYAQIGERLSQNDRVALEQLWVIAPESTTTLWQDLKQDPGRATLTHLQTWIERQHQLLALQWGQAALVGIPLVKVKHFAAEAMTLDAARMKQTEPHKRYTLAVAMLAVQSARTLDDLAELFIKQMTQMHHKGKAALAEYRLQTQPRTDELVTTLREMVLGLSRDTCKTVPPTLTGLNLTYIT